MWPSEPQGTPLHMTLPGHRLREAEGPLRPKPDCVLRRDGPDPTVPSDGTAQETAPHTCLVGVRLGPATCLLGKPLLAGR